MSYMNFHLRMAAAYDRLRWWGGSKDVESPEAREPEPCDDDAPTKRFKRRELGL